MEAAIRYGLQAVALLRAAEDDVDLGHLENHLALAYLANCNFERAGDLAHSARVAAAARRDLFLAAALAETEARVALSSGDPEAAVELASEALDLADRSENSRTVLEGLVTRARGYAQLGRHEGAAADFERAAGLADSAHSARRRDVLSAWADSLAALGQHDRAFALAREALDQR
jgi:tetratricopeptide (TPR) repeat protein